MADWDENNPTDSFIVKQYPANERAHRTAAKANFGVDHHETDDDDVGKHETIQMLAQSTPTAAAGQGNFYTKDVGAGVIELFYQDAAGNELQLTKAGKLGDNTVVLASLVNGILTADATGRAKMADGFVNTAKLLDGLLTADAAGRAKMASGYVNADLLGADSVIAGKVKRGSSQEFQELTAGSSVKKIISFPAGAAVYHIAIEVYESGSTSVLKAQSYLAADMVAWPAGLNVFFVANNGIDDVNVRYTVYYIEAS